jgi:hypothetical protein
MKNNKKITYTTNLNNIVINEDSNKDTTGKNRLNVSEFKPIGNFKNETYFGKGNTTPIVPIVKPLELIFTKKPSGKELLGEIEKTIDKMVEEGIKELIVPLEPS